MWQVVVFPHRDRTPARMNQPLEKDLLDSESIDDDLWFELSSEIQDLIQDFVVATANSFGVEFHDVYVQWG